MGVSSDTFSSPRQGSKAVAQQPPRQSWPHWRFTPDTKAGELGGFLIRAGLEASRATGYDLVFVLGHPGYYQKHGFVVAGINGFEAPYPIAPEHADAWMVQELRPGMIGKVCGRVICADSLMDPKHWRE